MATDLRSSFSLSDIASDLLAVESATPGAGIDSTARVVKGANGTETPLYLGTTTVHINKNNGNMDFIVDGDTTDNVLVVDASADRVGIKTNAPESVLDVDGVLTLREQVATPSGAADRVRLVVNDDKLYAVDKDSKYYWLSKNTAINATLVKYNTAISTGVQSDFIVISKAYAGMNIKSITFSCDDQAVVGSTNTRIVTYKYKSSSPVKVISGTYTELLYTARTITETGIDGANDEVSEGDIIFFNVTQAGSHKGLFVTVELGY